MIYKILKDKKDWNVLLRLMEAFFELAPHTKQKEIRPPAYPCLCVAQIKSGSVFTIDYLFLNKNDLKDLL